MVSYLIKTVVTVNICMYCQTMGITRLWHANAMDEYRSSSPSSYSCDFLLVNVLASQNLSSTT